MQVWGPGQTRDKEAGWHRPEDPGSHRATCSSCSTRRPWASLRASRRRWLHSALPGPSLPAWRPALCRRALVFTGAFSTTLPSRALIFMPEMHYLMAELFDFSCAPLIPPSEVIDLFFATLWIKRLPRSRRLIFPARPAREAVPICSCHGAALRAGPQRKGNLRARDRTAAVTVPNTGHFVSMAMDCGP